MGMTMRRMRVALENQSKIGHLFPEQTDVGVRLYVMVIIGSLIDAGGSRDATPTVHLHLLRDVKEIDGFAWGAALLANTYRALKQRKKIFVGASSVIGMFLLHRIIP